MFDLQYSKPASNPIRRRPLRAVGNACARMGDRRAVGKPVPVLFVAILVSVIPLSWTNAAVAQEPELIVEIEKQEVYEGESVLYRVTLNHVENPSAPSLEGFEDFQVTSLGEQSMDSRQITIFNGRRTEIVRRGRQYNYRLTPLKTGMLSIPAPTAVVDGETLTGQPVSINVIAPEAQDHVILQMAIDRDMVYPMQPFSITLTIAVKALPDNLATRDPLTVQPNPPVLTVPWLDDQQIPDGLQPTQDWKQILQPMISRRGDGFQINNIGSSSVFSLFDSQATGFHPSPQKITRTDSSGQPALYWQYQFERKLLPRRTGRYSLGPVTLKGTFATDVRQGQLVGEQLYIVAPAAEVMVRDVPTEGRPKSYIGAVGTFDVKTSLSPQTAQVGDPMTLTLTITGQGTLDEVQPPDLSALSGLNQAFRTYEATQETQGPSRQFTYSLRPLTEDVTEFPSIPISFFDVESEQYRTIDTAPIPVTIKPATTLSAADIVSASGSSNTGSSVVQAREGGLFANDANLSSLKNEAIRPVRWMIAWGSMMTGCLLISVIGRRVQTRRQDPALQRRLLAASRAAAAIKEATQQQSMGENSAACETARKVVSGLVADHLNLEAASLTPRDIAEALQAKSVDDSLQQQVRQFLEDCDAARYGAAGDNTARLVQSASQLTADLSAALHRINR